MVPSKFKDDFMVKTLSIVLLVFSLSSYARPLTRSGLLEKFKLSSLEGLDLTDLNLIDAKLQGANLASANLIGMDLIGVNLKGAFLRWTKFQNADLTDANLSGAYLKWANLQGATLINADLRYANLTEADLRGADLTKIKWTFFWSNTVDFNKAIYNEDTKFPKGLDPEKHEMIKKDVPE